MKFWNKICGLAIIFFLSVVFAKAQSVKNGALFMPATIQLKNSSAEYLLKQNSSALAAFYVNDIIKPNYYTQHFGFVCKKELALQKAIKVPLHIRLGSLQQCNYLEGKR